MSTVLNEYMMMMSN